MSPKVEFKINKSMHLGIYIHTYICIISKLWEFKHVAIINCNFLEYSLG